MSNKLTDKYNIIEQKRIKLKERWILLKNNRGDKEEIKRLGTELTKLTFNQVHMLIALELK